MRTHSTYIYAAVGMQHKTWQRNRNSFDLCVRAASQPASRSRQARSLARSTTFNSHAVSVNELNESGAFIQKFQCNYNPTGVACLLLVALLQMHARWSLSKARRRQHHPAQSDPIVTAWSLYNPKLSHNDWSILILFCAIRVGVKITLIDFIS